MFVVVCAGLQKMGIPVWRRASPSGNQSNAQPAILSQLRADLVWLNAPRRRAHQDPVLGSFPGTRAGAGSSVQQLGLRQSLLLPARISHEPDEQMFCVVGLRSTVSLSVQACTGSVRFLVLSEQNAAHIPFKRLARPNRWVTDSLCENYCQTRWPITDSYSSKWDCCWRRWAVTGFVNIVTVDLRTIVPCDDGL